MNENDELLNHMYNDATMAIYSITEMLKDIKLKDNKIKDTTNDILKGYERYLNDIEKLIKKDKIIKKEPSLMAKMGNSMGIKKEVMMDNSDSSMADMLIKGISLGSIDMEKKVTSYKDKCDKRIINLAIDFMDFQKDNINLLKKYL